MTHGKKKKVEAKQQEPKAKKVKAPAPALPATTGKPRRGQHQITIEEDMTIYTATAQKVMLLEALANCQELDLDLSQVSEMDTAGFQLLLLAKREAMKAGKEVRLTAHSQAVTVLLDLYNMAGYFGDPLVIPAGEHAAGQASR